MKTVQVDCTCRGDNDSCVNCHGSGKVSMVACMRCGGSGRTGGVCQDCRGQGWRDLDQPLPFPD